jgi:hypothetical protein
LEKQPHRDDKRNSLRHADHLKRRIERSGANGGWIVLQSISRFEAFRCFRQMLDSAANRNEWWIYTLQPFLVGRAGRQEYSTDLDFRTGSVRRKIPAADTSKELLRVAIKAP